MHLTLVSTPRPRESLAEETIDDVRPGAIRRLRYPKYRRDAPTPVIKTRCVNPKLTFASIYFFFRRSRVLRLLRSFWLIGSPGR